MFILGLVLIVVGAIAILGAVTSTSGSVDFLGFDGVSGVVIFFIGLGSGIAILLGLSVIRYGAKRSLQRRRENKRLTELSGQLDRVDRDNRNRDDEDRPTTI